MNRTTTQAIVLARTNYGEAARIITLITPDQGKVRAMAKGVRKQKSKLAGGLELFSVSDVTLLTGRGEVKTLISTRLLTHYGNIVKNLDRTNTGYDFIKTINAYTEDNVEPAYFNLLNTALKSLDNFKINLELIQLWFNAQLLGLSGLTPNLQIDEQGNKLEQSKKYQFDYTLMGFKQADSGQRALNTDHIKFLRLLFEAHNPAQLQKIQNLEKLLAQVHPIVQSMLSVQVQI